jgi:hypothetical protein
MMGVLTIKFGGSSGRKPDDSGNIIGFIAGGLSAEAGGWSAYAQMVIGMLPLLLLTACVYWWFGQGYDKLINNSPMEVIGKVVKDLVREVSDDEELLRSREGKLLLSRVLRHDKHFDVGGIETPRSHQVLSGLNASHLESSLAALDSTQERFRDSTGHLDENESRKTLSRRRSEIGTELKYQRAISSPSRVISVASQNSNLGHSDATAVNIPPSTNANGSSSVRSLNQRSSLFSLNPPSDGGVASLFDESADTSLFPDSQGDFAEDDEEEETQSNAEDIQPLLTSSSSRLRSRKILEPPSTRVPGILDAPFGSAILPEGDETDLMFHVEPGESNTVVTDLSLHTYIHPCLIGRKYRNLN